MATQDEMAVTNLREAISKKHPKYEILVYEDGRIFSLRKKLFHKTHVGTKGYLQTSITIGKGKYASKKIHTLVLEAFKGPRPVGYEGAHLDGDKNNNHASNLAWVTPKENSLHRDEHGTTARGSRNGQTTLTEKQVIEIRRTFVGGGRGKSNAALLAKKFNVTQATIRNIFRKIYWRHVV